MFGRMRQLAIATVFKTGYIFNSGQLLKTSTNWHIPTAFSQRFIIILLSYCTMETINNGAEQIFDGPSSKARRSRRRRAETETKIEERLNIMGEIALCSGCKRRISATPYVFARGCDYCIGCYAKQAGEGDKYLLISPNKKSQQKSSFSIPEQFSDLEAAEILGIQSYEVIAKSAEPIIDQQLITELTEDIISWQSGQKAALNSPQLPQDNAQNQKEMQREEIIMGSLGKSEMKELFNDLQEVNYLVSDYLLGSLHERSDPKDAAIVAQFKVFEEEQKAAIFAEIQKIMQAHKQADSKNLAERLIIEDQRAKNEKKREMVRKMAEDRAKMQQIEEEIQMQFNDLMALLPHQRPNNLLKDIKQQEEPQKQPDYEQKERHANFEKVAKSKSKKIVKNQPKNAKFGSSD